MRICADDMIGVNAFGFCLLLLLPVAHDVVTGILKSQREDQSPQLMDVCVTVKLVRIQFALARSFALESRVE